MNNIYTDPILVFFGTEIAYAPKQFFSALLRSFSGPKRMIFHFQPVRQKSCQSKPKLFQYIDKHQIIVILYIIIFQLWFFVAQKLLKPSGKGFGNRVVGICSSFCGMIFAMRSGREKIILSDLKNTPDRPKIDIY